MRAINSAVDSLSLAAPHSLLLRFSPKWQNYRMLVGDVNIRPDVRTNALWESVHEILVATRIQLAQEANNRRRTYPQDQVSTLVKLHSSALSRESQFKKLEPIFLGPYPGIKCILDNDN